MSALEFRTISDEESTLLERTAHNPPIYSETFTPDDFSNEYSLAYDGLKACLEIFGEDYEAAGYEHSDFMLPETHGQSRWIYVTLTSTRMFRPELVVAVSQFLAGLSMDYRVAFLNELRDEEFLNHPLIYLVVSSNLVVGNAIDPRSRQDGDPVFCNDYLKCFGFPPGAIAK